MTKEHHRDPNVKAFLNLLKELYDSCGSPSYRKLAKISKRLKTLYSDRDLPRLSPTAISEILAGQRKGLPSPDWVASFVLCCQRWAYETGTKTEDPGTTTLPDWQQRLKAARGAQTDKQRDDNDATQIDRSTGRPADPPPTLGEERPASPPPSARPRQDTPDPGTTTRQRDTPAVPPPAPDPGGDGPSDLRMADARPANAVQLPTGQREIVAGYGPHGQALLTEMQAGVPDAVYRVAVVLLGTDPAGADHAESLLMQAGAAGHQRALELLDAGPVRLDRLDAAAHAYELATVAAAEGQSAQARVYYECAAACLPAAAFELAEALMASGDDEQAVEWLTKAADLGDGRAESWLAKLRRHDRFRTD